MNPSTRDRYFKLGNQPLLSKFYCDIISISTSRNSRIRDIKALESSSMCHKIYKSQLTREWFLANLFFPFQKKSQRQCSMPTPVLRRLILSLNAASSSLPFCRCFRARDLQVNCLDSYLWCLSSDTLNRKPKTQLCKFVNNIIR